MVNIVINGLCGHMGQTIAGMALQRPNEFNLLGGVDKSELKEVLGVPVFSSIQDIPAETDVVIDLSVPQALEGILTYCSANGKGIVIGTTGLGDAQLKLIQRMADKTSIFHSGNMSLGVNLQIELIKEAAATLGDHFDVEIIEKHHNLKIDAPSGTALMLANALSSQYPSEREYVYGRHNKNQRRKPNEIGIHAVRGGTLVGEHSVEFIGKDEVIEVTHRAFSKQVFATGALRAAQYISTKAPGLYNMHDIVTERDVLSHIYTEEEQAIITLSNLPHEAGVLSSVFQLIADNHVFVDMISTSAPGGTAGYVSFSLKRTDLAAAVNALKPLRMKYMGMDMHTRDNITKLTVEGAGMALRHGVAAQVFDVLSKAGVCVEFVTTSETKIACCISDSEVPAAVTSIAAYFEL